ncbi:MAG: YraN family protein [Candidatus Peribacteraceae bacterium]|nr:YraN family protein [Candidatus Peribacteraceae bacterium]
MEFPFLSSDRLQPSPPFGGLLPASRPKHLILGAQGEDLAAAYVRSINYTVRHRNVRQGKDEIDIIAWDPEDQVLVFVEVKTRTEKTRDGFHPDQAATEDKRIKLRRAVRRWVADHQYDGGYRIDLICVHDGAVKNHFKELNWDVPPRSTPWP